MVVININFLEISSSNNDTEKNPKYMQYVVYLLNIYLYMCVSVCVSVCLCSNVYNILKYLDFGAIFFFS